MVLQGLAEPEVTELSGDMLGMLTVGSQSECITLAPPKSHAL